MAVASLVLGIIGLITSFVAIGGFFCLLGLIFGFIASRNPEKKGLAIGGIVTSIIGIFIFLIILIVAVRQNKTQGTSKAETSTESVEEKTEKAKSDQEEKTKDKQEENEAQEENIDNTESFTLSQKNAIRKAKSYIDNGITHHSREGLIRQLTSEWDQFPEEDAIFAVEYLESHNLVDWKEQAAKAAQSYMDTFGYSRDALITQLTSDYDGFTQEEAEYGAKAVGY